MKKVRLLKAEEVDYVHGVARTHTRGFDLYLA